MTTTADICNRMLQKIGTRTNVTAAELTAASSNEAIQFNLIYPELRDTLLRMAPWDCALKTANLTYISSLPGTPENQSQATSLWTPGQPPPPWAYEYQYPVDCLLMVSVYPTMQTGFTSGIPITTAVTGGASSYLGPPVRFKVQTDTFFPVTSAFPIAGGTNYAVGDIITLPIGPITSPPIGAPVQLQVATITGSAIATVNVINQVLGEASPLGGSYFNKQFNAIAQASTTGIGTGATFGLAFANPASPQRVVLTNQEFATGSYIQQVTDPNIFDPTFREALYSVGAATLNQSLSGDKKLSNQLITLANRQIEQARNRDGNEGLSVNDTTPDWIRFRDIWYTEGYLSGPYVGFDWGSLFPSYY